MAAFCARSRATSISSLLQQCLAGMWLPVTMVCSQIMSLAGSAPAYCAICASRYSMDLYIWGGGAPVAQAARRAKAAALAMRVRLGLIGLPAVWCNGTVLRALYYTRRK